MHDQRGQALPLVALVVATAGITCLLLGRLGGAAVTRARADAAADAVALAGAAHGRDAAADVARDDGATLVSFVVDGAVVQVEVALGRARSAARARRRSSQSRPGPDDRPVAAGDVVVGADHRGGLDPAMADALARADTRLGFAVSVTSGYRSPAAQQRLWDERATNPYPVARPGTSRHERGRAVDVPLRVVPDLLRVGPEVGLCQPYPIVDPVHFELCPITGGERATG